MAKPTQRSAAQINAELTTPIADTAAGAALAAMVAAGDAPAAVVAAARDAHNQQTVNPYDELLGNPNDLHFTPQNASQATTLKNGTIRRYLAKCTALGTYLSAEMTVVSSGKIAFDPTIGQYEQREIDIWLPRGMTVNENTAGHFDDWKSRVLNRFDKWSDEQARKTANVVAISNQGARLIRKVPIAAAPQKTA